MLSPEGGGAIVVIVALAGLVVLGAAEPRGSIFYRKRLKNTPSILYAKRFSHKSVLLAIHFFHKSVVYIKHFL